MPSLLELLESARRGRPEPEARDAVPLDVLASVKTEGRRRRHRRQRRNVALGGLALALVAVPALALGGGGGDDTPQELSITNGPLPGGSAEAAGDTGRLTTTTVRATTSTTLPAEVLGEVIERPAPGDAAAGADDTPAATTPTTARPRPTTSPTTAAPTTAPPPVCSNSVDSACGAFRWSPEPGGNGGLAFDVIGTTTVAAGGTLTFDVVWSDPDAMPSYTDDDTDGTLLIPACTTQPRFGPWAPPAAGGGTATRTVTFADTATPGTYQVQVYASSQNGDCAYDPYGSERTATITVEVTPA